jgi:hypothetical protein
MRTRSLESSRHRMPSRTTTVMAGALALALGAVASRGQAAPARRPADLDRGFSDGVKPFLESYCLGCHDAEKAKGDLDLRPFLEPAKARDPHRWTDVLERLSAQEMPPAKAKQPPPEARRKVVAWIEAVRLEEARKHAGDPGTVLARRLSNAEYNYTIRDLTGVDIRLLAPGGLAFAPHPVLVETDRDRYTVQRIVDF